MYIIAVMNRRTAHDKMQFMYLKEEFIMIIESKIDFQPSEIDELFNSIIGIAAKVKLGMDMKGKISEARWEKNDAEQKLQQERERFDLRVKEMQEDHKAEIKALKAEIEKLKEAKKEAKKPVAAK